LISTHPPAALPRPSGRSSAPSDATDLAAWCTSMCTSHDVTGFLAPTGNRQRCVATAWSPRARSCAGISMALCGMFSVTVDTADANILAFAAQLLLSPRTGTSATVKGGFGSERPSPRCRARLSLHEEASGGIPLRLSDWSINTVTSQSGQNLTTSVLFALFKNDRPIRGSDHGRCRS